ncbi:Planctomycete cytochrome C (modular protein) [Verrucomicrobia bacterium]|nr:Planctomycete cytochrome C (modular protein) [Verrucomicrobiota bacterium]
MNKSDHLHPGFCAEGERASAAARARARGYPVFKLARRRQYLSRFTRVFLTLALASLGRPMMAEGHWDISGIDASKLPPVASQQDVTFAKDIKPLLAASCLRCHGEQRPKGNLRLDSLDGVLKGGKDGKVVAAGNSKKSLLVIAAARIDDNTAMPPKRGPGGPGGPGGGGPPPGSPPAGSGAPGQGPNGSGRGLGGPPPKPLTPEQVGLVRAWIDQGAK